jgi:hypothetical protein
MEQETERWIQQVQHLWELEGGSTEMEKNLEEDPESS